MADCNDGFVKSDADFINGNEELDHGIASPVDCWELVGSGPGSPLPEARVVGSALEKAMAAACTSGGSLQDDYFVCTQSPSKHEDLPLSSVTADRQSEDEGHSSSRSDALVSVDSDIEACDKCTGTNFISPMRKNDDGNGAVGLTHYDAYMGHIEDINFDDGNCYINEPHHVFLGEHSDAIDIKQHSGEDHVSHMCIGERMEHEDVSHTGSEVYFHGPTQGEEGNLHVMSCPRASSRVEASTDASNQMSSLVVLGEQEAVSSSHDLQDYSLTEGGWFPSASEDASSEPAGQVEDSLGMEWNVIYTSSSRYCKAFTCASWLWNCISRWQARFGWANTICSMALAAAVMGVLILGRGWQRLQAQNRSLRAQLQVKEKRIMQLMLQLMQVRDSLAKARQVPVICVKPAVRIAQDHFD